MQQVRQVAHGVQRAVGDRPRVLRAACGATAGGFDRALRDGELDLDRREHLADFVVQLARDAAPLLFLRGDQLRGQALQVGAAPRFTFLLDSQLPLQFATR